MRKSLFILLIGVALLLAGPPSGRAFSLLGPLDTWQVSGIGYNLAGDIGGPMNLGEEYRWNQPVIYFAFDESFVNYFGPKGVAAVQQAMAILNALPSTSQMSPNLTEFPLDTRRINYQAQALNLVDIKSAALSAMLEELGLAEPERWVWSLRARTPLPNNGPTNYTVIRRNFDPVTESPSSFVNGVLYTYQIFDQQNPQIADAVERELDPLALGFNAVAGANFFVPGQFFTGLTRDDVGGLRYLLKWDNRNIETLPPTAFLTNSPTPIPGEPVFPPPPVVTNVNQVLRPGLQKITFVQANFDSGLGAFVGFTNQYTDIFITNNTVRTQTIRKPLLTGPDILFAASDLGVGPTGFPFVYQRTTAAAPAWQNNNLINGGTTLAGPGQINGPVQIIFNKVGPFIINQTPSLLDEFNFVISFAQPDLFSPPAFIWGSFDGTTNPPVVFPQGFTIQDLEAQLFGN